MTKTDFIWLMIIGILGAVGTSPEGTAWSRGILVFLAWCGLALFGLLCLLGVIA